MEIHDFDQLSASKELVAVKSVLSIGVYDGLHIGHQRIISSAVRFAKDGVDMKTVVITFAQNPKTLSAGTVRQAVMSLRQSTDFLRLGVIICCD